LARVRITRVSDLGPWPEGTGGPRLASSAAEAGVADADGGAAAHLAAPVDAALRAGGVQTLATAAGVSISASNECQRDSNQEQNCQSPHDYKEWFDVFFF